MVNLTDFPLEQLAVPSVLGLKDLPKQVNSPVCQNRNRWAFQVYFTVRFAMVVSKPYFRAIPFLFFASQSLIFSIFFFFFFFFFFFLRRDIAHPDSSSDKLNLSFQSGEISPTLFNFSIVISAFHEILLRFYHYLLTSCRCRPPFTSFANS